MTRGRSILAAGALLTGALTVFHIAAVSAQSAAPRPPQPQVAKVVDLMQMMAALPDAAPAQPKQPRKVLVLAKAAGYVHSSIPLATRTIEALGQKTGAWTTVITYNPADINTDEPEAVRRDLPGEHHWHVPRRPGRPGSDDRAARGAARVRAVRQGHRRHPCRHRRLPRHACWNAAAGRGGRNQATRRRRRGALARLHRPHRRLLQVPLVFPDADRREAGRSRQPDQRAVQAARVLDRGRGLHVQPGLVLAVHACTCWPASTTTRCRRRSRRRSPRRSGRITTTRSATSTAKGRDACS